MDLERSWNEQGFFIKRGLIDEDEVAAIEAEIVAAIRADPPRNHGGERLYPTVDDLLIYPEKSPSPAARNPEDYIAKVFNGHCVGTAKAIATDPRLTDPLAPLLGANLDCFQSQFIFKNPGVIGQPWHQDSYYFRYDRQPQATVWVALSAATLDNGCLWVVPGSHRAHEVFDHVPDQRPESLQGYLEIVSQDTSMEEPVLMEPGDVLFFHSYLMHRSTDNIADYRRSAMVYHYAENGTQPIDALAAATLAPVNRWMPARRAATPLSA
ncbi:phytanoyl-CoA dioxygenase family protein [Hephaestia sp. GCM10023244]|uniref:phytanoyl-CoA dioxygenase family protein n=1 Tax=unclassified Hephaestia TaxID=2631281 RepID=UPI002076E8D6|nr:phytanoyl-CoA dioxygenase family protein [Hephaestia sp. MAHUQ-44]MCM8729357.1 phytanoyl-CoA dioxygenase family protein [Hephaestia sp. MAHUQ-44]